jgi:DNA adenine methylase
MPSLRLFRWLGAKSHLVEVLAPVLRAQLERDGRLISLFYGSGALEQTVGLEVEQVAAEANPDLRALYRAVAGSPARVESALRHLDADSRRTHEGFATVRAIAPDTLEDAERAARFLWLSRFAFNGIWRVNGAGQFNVRADPGRLARPWTLPTRMQLEQLGERVRPVRFVDDWQHALQLARPNDLVLSDPPYLGGFVAYTASRFSLAEQHLLASRLAEAAATGRAVMAFNSTAALPLYEGWASVTVRERSGRVSCRGFSRGPVGELIATAGFRSLTNELVQAVAA